jgi:hypothetical protein
MTQEEKQQNMVLVIQVPLVSRHFPHFRHLMNKQQMEQCAPAIPFAAKANVEDAIIKIGSSEGRFSELDTETVERDTQWPIRVTLQFYKCTDDGFIDDEVVKQISDQLAESKKKAVYIGSSVVAPDSKRPTAYSVPVWWDNWWLTYRSVFPQFTKEEAQARVFVDGRFADKTMSEASDRLVQMLSSEKNVSWNVL